MSVQGDESPPIGELVRQLRGGRPYFRESTLEYHNGSMRLRLMMEGVRDAGRDPENPGTVDQWYFPEYQVALVDLAPDEH